MQGEAAAWSTYAGAASVSSYLAWAKCSDDIHLNSTCLESFISLSLCVAYLWSYSLCVCTDGSSRGWFKKLLWIKVVPSLDDESQKPHKSDVCIRTAMPHHNMQTAPRQTTSLNLTPCLLLYNRSTQLAALTGDPEKPSTQYSGICRLQEGIAKCQSSEFPEAIFPLASSRALTQFSLWIYLFLKPPSHVPVPSRTALVRFTTCRG